MAYLLPLCLSWVANASQLLFFLNFMFLLILSFSLLIVLTDPYDIIFILMALITIYMLMPFFFFCFLGPYLWHMEVSRLGVKSELQLPADTTATATQDPNVVCDLQHSSRQCRIPNPLSEARDRTRIFKDTSCICFDCTTIGTPADASYICISNLYFPFHV